jgi:DNA-binding response OmpR family regulator
MTKDPSSQNFLALIIEDDPKLATIFSLAFQRAGYETEIIEDGRTATERLAAIIPDVVILDLHLPYVSGADILKRIRANERLAHTQVIVMTADLFRADALRGQADAVLFKPISFIQLQNLATKLRTSQTAKPIE